MPEVTVTFKFEVGDLVTVARARDLTQGPIPAFRIASRRYDATEDGGAEMSYLARAFVASSGVRWCAKERGGELRMIERPYNSYGHYLFLETELEPLPDDWQGRSE